MLGSYWLKKNLEMCFLLILKQPHFEEPSWTCKKFNNLITVYAQSVQSASPLTESLPRGTFDESESVVSLKFSKAFFLKVSSGETSTKAAIISSILFSPSNKISNNNDVNYTCRLISQNSFPIQL